MLGRIEIKSTPAEVGDLISRNKTIAIIMRPSAIRDIICIIMFRQKE
jgi:hypothetical protein